MIEGPSDRIVILPQPGGVSIEIRPLARTRRARWRLGLAAAVVLAAALAGSSRLARAWDAGLRKGSFEDLPLAVLLPMTLAVGISLPAALAGLAALAFAEERIEVTAESVEISTTAFERTTVRTFPRSDLEAWVETYRPIPPWWTWAFRRLAARAAGRLHPVAGAAGQSEKRRIALALVRATGAPLVTPAGRPVRPDEAAKIPR